MSPSLRLGRSDPSHQTIPRLDRGSKTSLHRSLDSAAQFRECLREPGLNVICCVRREEPNIGNPKVNRATRAAPGGDGTSRHSNDPAVRQKIKGSRLCTIENLTRGSHKRRAVLRENSWGLHSGDIPRTGSIHAVLLSGALLSVVIEKLPPLIVGEIAGKIVVNLFQGQTFKRSCAICLSGSFASVTTGLHG